MMYGTSSTGPWIWLHIHWLFWGLAIFGFIAGLMWLNKHASKKDFLNVVWLTLAIGVVGGLLTASVSLTGWYQMMDAHHGSYGDKYFGPERHVEMREAMEDFWEEVGDEEDFDIDDMMDEMMNLDDESNS